MTPEQIKAIKERVRDADWMDSPYHKKDEKDGYYDVWHDRIGEVGRRLFCRATTRTNAEFVAHAQYDIKCLVDALEQSQAREKLTQRLYSERNQDYQAAQNTIVWLRADCSTGRAQAWTLAERLNAHIDASKWLMGNIEGGLKIKENYVCALLAEVAQLRAELVRVEGIALDLRDGRVEDDVTVFRCGECNAVKCIDNSTSEAERIVFDAQYETPMICPDCADTLYTIRDGRYCRNTPGNMEGEK